MTKPTDAFTTLRALGFNPTQQGLDRAVDGLAKRLANYERALAETREMLADAEKRGALKALRRKAGDYALGDSPVAGPGVARDLDLYADAIERGEVTP